jgi:hypothetical protein
MGVPASSCNTTSVPDAPITFIQLAPGAPPGWSVDASVQAPFVKLTPIDPPKVRLRKLPEKKSNTRRVKIRAMEH